MTVIQLINAFVRTQKKPYQILSESLIANGLVGNDRSFFIVVSGGFRGILKGFCKRKCKPEIDMTTTVGVVLYTSHSLTGSIL